jgi:hypothetical protein
MSTEITVTNIVKYETIVSTYDSFTARRIRVTDRFDNIIEFVVYHTTGNLFEHVPLKKIDRREKTKDVLSEDE